MSRAELQQLAAGLVYKPGWTFALHGGWSFSNGPISTPTLGWPGQTHNTGGTMAVWPDGEPLALVIEIYTPDSGDPSETVLVQHRFPVPPGPPPGGWRRWLLDQVLAVETHEACEFFQVEDSRPFYPEHGPDADLYAIRERALTS